MSTARSLRPTREVIATAAAVLAGSAPTALEPVGSPVGSTGFETPMTIASTAPYFAVQALGPTGQVLATSPAVGAVAS